MNRTRLGILSPRWLLAGAMLLSPAPGALLAQLPVARLASLFPPGGRAGSTVEVAVAGADLDEASRLHFSNKDITARPKGEEGKFTVAIASNVPPGVYEARFVGRFGISNPRAFVVGALPESLASTTNTSSASAVELAPNTTVNGRVTANSISWFKFTAKKGERFFIEDLAESIDSRMDAMLILGTPAGRELESARTGGLIDFTAPAAGGYLLRVSDVLYRGGDEYFHRLTLSTGPRVDYVFPPALLPGTKTNLTFYGRNLPGGKPVKGLAIDGKSLEQLSVEITAPARPSLTAASPRPAAAVVDGFSYRLKTPKGSAAPVFIGLATAPVVPEQEPNSKPAQAQKISPPCEVAGQFYPAGDADWFAFEAKKGDVLWLEVFSQRLGLPVDPFLLVQRMTKNDKGEEQTSDVLEAYDQDTNIGEREFNTTSRDPVARFEAKEDGAYRVQVRDLFNRTVASPRHVYRLSLRRETPDFQLVANVVVPKYKADAKDIPIGIPLLRRGETLPIRVMAFRRDGFNGDIELSLAHPPPGLRFDGDRIEAGKSTDFILLTAAADAPAFAGPVKLIGKAKAGDREVVHEARGGTMIFQVATTDNERPEPRLTREFALAITDQEEAPVSIAAAETKTWEAIAKSKLEIPLRVTRRGDFNATFKLKPLGPGPADALKEFEADGKATNATLKLDLDALKLAPGRYVFAVQGNATGKYRNNPEAASLADAVAKEADKTAGEFAAAAKKAAEELEKSVKAAGEAEMARKADQEKLAEARSAAENSSEDEPLKAELAAAQTSADEAAEKAKAATEAKAAAEKARASADAKAKEAQSRKDSTAKRAKELNEKAKPRDVTYQVTSAPIVINVTPAPVAEAKETKEAKKQ